jgi:hypothetical protein
VNRLASMHILRVSLVVSGSIGAAACGDLFGPRGETRLATVDRLLVADSVPAGAQIRVDVRWMSGACERPLGVSVSSRADTIVIAARVREDASVHGPCGADFAIERDTTLMLPGRAPGQLQLRGLAYHGVSASAQVRIYEP